MSSNPPQDISPDDFFGSPDHIRAVASQYGLRVSSGKRSPQHNAAVGGAPNSYHLKGQAYDFAGDPKSMREFHDNMSQWDLPENLDEGNHIHTAYKRPAGDVSPDEFFSGQGKQAAAPRRFTPAPKSAPAPLSAGLSLTARPAAQADDSSSLATPAESATLGKPTPPPLGRNFIETMRQGPPPPTFAQAAQARGAKVGAPRASTSAGYGQMMAAPPGGTNSPVGVGGAPEVMATRPPAISQKQLDREMHAANRPYRNQRLAEQNTSNGAEATLANATTGLAKVGANTVGLVGRLLGDEDLQDTADSVRENAEDYRASHGSDSFIGNVVHGGAQMAPALVIPGGPLGFGAFEASQAYGEGQPLSESIKRGITSAATAKLGGELATGLQRPLAGPAEAYAERAIGNTAAPVIVRGLTEGRVDATPEDVAFGALFGLHGGREQAERRAGIEATNDAARAQIDRRVTGSMLPLKEIGNDRLGAFDYGKARQGYEGQRATEDAQDLAAQPRLVKRAPRAEGVPSAPLAEQSPPSFEEWSAQQNAPKVNPTGETGLEGIGEPPVPAGHLRLYRGDGQLPPGSGSHNAADAGRWFTDNRAMAEDYAEAARTGAETKPLRYVDVPANEARMMLRRSGSEKPNEYVVSDKYFSSAADLPGSGRAIKEQPQAPTVTTIKPSKPADRRVKPDSDSLLAAIQKIGVDPNYGEVGRLLKESGKMRPGMLNKQRSYGQLRGDDWLVQQLEQHGWHFEDDPAMKKTDHLAEMVGRELQGKPVYSRDYDHVAHAEEKIARMAEEFPHDETHKSDAERMRALFSDATPDVANLVEKIQGGEYNEHDWDNFEGIARYQYGLSDEAITSLREEAESNLQSAGRQLPDGRAATGGVEASQPAISDAQRGAVRDAAEKTGDVDADLNSTLDRYPGRIAAASPDAGSVSASARQRDISGRRQAASVLPGQPDASQLSREAGQREGDVDVQTQPNVVSRSDTAAGSSRERDMDNAGRLRNPADIQSSTDQIARASGILETLKSQSKETGQSLSSLVEDRINQHALPGMEQAALSASDANLLRQMATPTSRRAPVTEKQGGLLDVAPTVESRQAQTAIAGRAQGEGAFAAPLLKGRQQSVRIEGDKAIKTANDTERKVYEALKGADHIAPAETKGNEVTLPNYDKVLSVDTLDAKARKGLAPVVNKIRAHINGAVSALTFRGYDYNDPLQFGLGKGREPFLFDFSNAQKDSQAESRNLGHLQNFYREFGLPEEANRIGIVADVLDGARAIHSGVDEAFVEPRVLGDVKKIDIDPKYAYYTTNAREVGIKDAAQTRSIEGTKVVVSSRPLTDAEISQWELTPVLHEAAKMPSDVHHSELQPRNDAGQFDGPPDFSLAEKAPLPAKGEHGHFINSLFKSPDPDAGIPSFWANPEVRAKLGLSADGKLAEAKDALAKELGLPRSSHISPDALRKWAADSGLGQDALTALDAAEAQYRAKLKAKEALEQSVGSQAATHITETAMAEGEASEPQVIKDARKRLQEALNGNKLSANPIQSFVDTAIITAHDVYKGTKDFAEWSTGMVKRLGERIKPILKDIYDRIGDFKPTSSMRDATPEERQSLRIPPAWQGVRIAEDPHARLVATGTDAKGRTQYLYSTAHTSAALIEKFTRQRDFNDTLPGILDRVNRDIDAGNNTEEAGVLRLIAHTGFRVGGDANTGDVQAFGATTLRPEHVTIDGDVVRFDFPGKRGIRQQHEIKDAGIAADLQSRIDSGNDRLFQTNDSKVRAYLHLIGGDFKVHDFRTWNATDSARQAIEQMPEPQSPKEFWAAVDKVGDIAARKIGDTRKVALESYVDPLVFDGWRQSAGVGEHEQRPTRASKAADDQGKTDGDEQSLSNASLRQGDWRSQLYEKAKQAYQENVTPIPGGRPSEGGFIRFGGKKVKTADLGDDRTKLQKVGDTAVAANYAGLIGPRNVASVKGGVASSLAMDTFADMILDVATRRMDAGQVVGGLSPSATLRAAREGIPEAFKNMKLAWQGKGTDVSEARNYHPSGLAPLDAVLTTAPRMFGTAEAGIKTMARDLALERMYERAARNDARDGVIPNSPKAIAAQVEAYKKNPTILGGINAEIASEEARAMLRYEALKRDLTPQQRLYLEQKWDADPRELWKAIASEQADRAVSSNPNLLSEAVKGLEKRAYDFSPVTGALVKGARQIVLPIAKRPAGAMAKFLTEYLGAPLNIPYRAIEGMVNKWDAPTTQKFARAIARGGVAYAIIGMGAAAHRTGHMTGMLDEDADRRGMLKVGDTYHNVSRIPFVGWLFAMGATIDEAMQKDGNGVGGFAKDVGAGLMHIAGEYPLMRAQKDIADIKDKGVSGYVGNLAQRVVPKTVESAAMLGDPTVRRADTPGEKIQARIPFARNYLAPRANYKGEPIEQGRLAGVLPDVVTGRKVSDSRSPAESLANQAVKSKMGTLPPMTPEKKERFDLKKQIVDLAKKGQMDEAVKALAEGLKSGKLAEADANDIDAQTKLDYLQYQVKKLPAEDALSIYFDKRTTPQERERIAEIIEKKLDSYDTTKHTQQEVDRLMPQVMEFVKSRAASQPQK